MRHHALNPIVRRTALAAGAAVAALLAADQAVALPVAGSAPATISAGGSQPIIQSGSNIVQVDLNAPRTIIDWASFNLNGGEQAQFRFDQRNWIVLNRVTGGPININGSVTAYQAANNAAALPNVTSGNVWFYSPQGVAFGGGASVDVGGLLATSAAVNEASFLNATNLNIPFTGSGSGGSVTVGGGASFAGKGYLAFVAPIVTTAAGANVNAGDYGTAAYAAVDSYEIRFRPAFNNDLTFFTFIVPNGAAGTPHDTPLNLAGTTTGANVYLMAISRATLTTVLINAPGLLVGQSSFNEYGQVTITTGRNITEGQVDATNSTAVAGARSGLVQLGEINAAGNVNIAVTGRFGTSDLTANRIRAGQGLLIAARDITVGSGGVISGNSNVNLGSTIIDSLGVVTIPTWTARTDITVQTGALQAGGPADVLPVLRLGSVTLGGRFSSVAETLNVSSMAAGSISSSTAGITTAASLTGSTDVLVASSTDLTLGTVQAGGLSRLTFQDLTLTGGVTADSIVLRILTPSDAVLGGTGTDRRVSNAEFQRFRATTFMSVFAGIEGQFPVSNDLVVEDLDIDPARIRELRLFAKNTEEVNIDGLVRPTAGGVVLKIGDAAADSIWKPLVVGVAGSLGSASGDALAGFTDVRAFDRVEIVATKDIALGSERFLQLIRDVPAAQIDISKGLPLGVAPTPEEVGRLFLVAGSASLFATDRIVQQNTGALGQQAGFFLTGAGVGATDPLLILGGAQVADVFGALQIADGVVTSGSLASSSSRIARAEGDTSTGSIRINGCQLAIGCATFTPATQFRIQQFRPAAPRAAIDPPVLTPPPPVDDDEREAESVITGTGNEEIWRRDR
ncbi:MAG: filamentous hemagglutinin N-terminal domain-containing protein [Alphaproteobacteria bacterium]|nr:filamentous hemagglutinin N-terminal domain-containing protein [Alphaproteobacteria bacterium]MBU1513109.1 filamentous hemagglutinin N-terminal domain-containing protein [Alphaproteobacteria bacterium]MBU2095217.1 filamentous hemagglutinin N-terminal domain-containing protein [Alphaproteobacteria bacterium]MBU2150624.1 filamentous hemagglutinin N-terminal domain-containing protein [Alphaproteobacteria bacterium]MBU2306117.1 filamentous hemagglutinin N-terminal domain-containing protein [Alph